DTYMTALLNKHYGAAISCVDSFLSIIEQNLAPFQDVLTIHPGDFRAQERPRSIAILFLDLCKTRETNYAMTMSFPSKAGRRQRISNTTGFHRRMVAMDICLYGAAS
ncbi:MAG TPA: hypothetical protein VKT26_04810, partial [Acetobacteraceae bacterium]|nr:hypothetical protein [Acetobacteraceae bacterium]